MSGNRGLLYGIAAASAGALIWVGFVRKVDADPGTLVRSSEMLLHAAQAMPESIDGAPNALRARFLAQAERDLALAGRAVETAGPAGAESGADDALAFILECRGFARYLSGDRQGAIALYRQALLDPGCAAERKRTIGFTIARILLGGGRPGAALGELDALARGRLAGPELATLHILRAEALLMQGAPAGELHASLAAAAAQADAAPEHKIRCSEIYEQLGMRPEALAVLERSAVDHAGALLPLARLKFRSGDVDGAVMALESAGSEDPAGLRAWLEKEGMTALLADPRLKAAVEQGAERTKERPLSAREPEEDQPGKRAGTGSPARTEKELAR